MTTPMYEVVQATPDSHVLDIGEVFSLPSPHKYLIGIYSVGRSVAAEPTETLPRSSAQLLENGYAMCNTVFNIVPSDTSMYEFPRIVLHAKNELEQVVSAPPKESRVSRTYIEAKLAASAELAIGNGWRVVEAPRATAQKEQDIPYDEYVQHFTEKTIPIAVQGEKLRDHDIAHTVDFVDLFTSELFATAVHTCALNAQGVPDLEKHFTESFDKFANSVRNVRTIGIELSSLNAAKTSLAALVDLHYVYAQAPHHVKQQLFAALWKATDMQNNEVMWRRHVGTSYKGPSFTYSNKH